MSIFSRALKVHANVLHRTAGEYITYKRGSLSIELRAVPGESRFENPSSDGEFHVETKTVDFLVQPTALWVEHTNDTPGYYLEPSRGDQIVRQDGTVQDVIPGASDSVWEWTDSYKTFFRVHTVKRSKGNVPIE